MFLDELLPKLKMQILLWWIMGIATPNFLLARWLDLPRQGGHEEAVLLFTSGSSGEPKGVVLSHHNIIGNVAQFTVMLDAAPEDSLLASLPFFHSFGCTVTLWYPLIEGVRAVTYPNPLEAKKIAELVEEYAVTVMLATGTGETVIEADPLLPSLVAVISVLPGATAVITPSLEIVATATLSELQVIARCVRGLPLTSRVVAVACVFCP